MQSDRMSRIFESHPTPTEAESGTGKSECQGDGLIFGKLESR